MNKRVTRRSEVEKAFDIKIAESSRMEDAIDLWRSMYEDNPIWANGDCEAIGLPGAISGEIARLVTNDLETNVTGSQMAEFLDEAYQRHVKDSKEYTEYACAMGGIVMKPYFVPSKGAIDVSIIQADEFFPTRFNSDGDIMGAIFEDQKMVGEYCFTRLERHELIGTVYGVENKCFCKKITDISSDYTLGDECPLSQVDDWKDIKPITIMQNIKSPLFAYFKMPIANNIEPRSPIGVSCFARAWKRIRRADIQWARINWEFDASETVIIADEDMFIKTRSGDLAMEKREKRLYRTVEGFKDQIHEFAPSIRDSSLFNGLEQYLRQIEHQCNLSFGTISNPNDVEKTAEEYKSSKFRSVSFVADVQSAFKKSHEALLDAMHTIAVLYGLCPDGDYEVMFNFDDTLAINRSEAFKELLQLAAAGMVKPEYVTSWYFGVSEEEARKMMPAPFDDTMKDEPVAEEE